MSEAASRNIVFHEQRDNRRTPSMQSLRRTLITISLALISLPAAAGHEAAYEEARRQVQILHDLEDPAYRRANERWLQEHEKRMAEYPASKINAEIGQLRREGEEHARLRERESQERARRIAAGEPDPDKVAAAWVWAVAAVLAMVVVGGSVWTRRRRAATPTLTP